MRITDSKSLGGVPNRLDFSGCLKELRAVQQSLTLPDGTTVLSVITAEGKKTFSSGEQD